MDHLANHSHLALLRGTRGHTRSHRVTNRTRGQMRPQGSHEGHAIRSLLPIYPGLARYRYILAPLTITSSTSQTLHLVLQLHSPSKHQVKPHSRHVPGDQKQQLRRCSLHTRSPCPPTRCGKTPPNDGESAINIPNFPPSHGLRPVVERRVPFNFSTSPVFEDKFRPRSRC